MLGLLLHLCHIRRPQEDLHLLKLHLLKEAHSLVSTSLLLINNRLLLSVDNLDTISTSVRVLFNN